MKRTLLIMALATAGTAANATVEVPSAEYYGAYVSAISDNGKWMVCEMDYPRSMTVVNLETGEKWMRVSTGADGAEDYLIGFTRAVSDDGTVVGEDWDIPSYWKADSRGQGVWTHLKGYVRNDTGVVSGMVGGITPDGSMIVGALGKGGGSIYGNGDSQMTYPCVWYRNDDGTYGDPVFLPTPGLDIFGRKPQYVHCLAVSADGRTIGGQMRSGSGFFHFPLVYTLLDNGEWELKTVGMNLVNPEGITPAPWPGDFDNDTPMPNYEEYMTPEQLAAFYAADLNSAWQAEGYNDDEIMVLEHIYAAEYMTGEKKAEYQALVDAWVNRYVTWEEAWEKYEESMIRIMETGWDFEFNNVFLSPDGKYIYSSGKSALASAYTPIRISTVDDSDFTIYANRENILMSGVTADYSILGREYQADSDMYSMGYIFPQGQTTPVDIVSYMQQNAKPEVYDWMEEHMYRSVVVGLTASGGEMFDDRWVVGKPISTPDMSVMAFGNSMIYWQTPPAPGVTDRFITFVLNTSLDFAGVEGIPVDDRAEATSPEAPAVYYNLQGVRVDNPGHGLYIRKQGDRTEKVVI